MFQPQLQFLVHQSNRNSKLQGHLRGNSFQVNSNSKAHLHVVIGESLLLIKHQYVMHAGVSPMILLPEQDWGRWYLEILLQLL